MEKGIDDQLARQMYQEHILELYKHPHNSGKLEGATGKHQSFNPLCGDNITMQVAVRNGKVENIKFIGAGCAISIAAASMLTDAVKGKTVSEIMKMKREDLLSMVKIPVSHVRLKCVLLPLEALQRALSG